LTSPLIPVHHVERGKKNSIKRREKFRMKIATFNCNSVRARVPIIVSWLEKEKPDVLALQEIKVETKSFPYEPFESLGYHCEVQGKKGHSGVATLSRVKPDEAIPGFMDGDEAEYSRILVCRYGKIYVFNTYIPQGRERESEHFTYKLKWFERLRKYLEEHYKKTGKLVWVGDFNVAPEPIDVYNSRALMGHVDHCEEVFEALKNVRDWGFIDLFRKFHPNEPNQFTYFDYRAIDPLAKNKGWRVDHVYTTISLGKKATRCWIDREPRTMERASDHTVLAAEFEI
jgi:exodeoxyribonuclease III